MHTSHKMLLKKLKFKINITLMLSSKTFFGVYLFIILMLCQLNAKESYYEEYPCLDFGFVVENVFFSPCRNPEAGDIEDISLDVIFSEDDSDVTGDDSESDGYLSEVVEYTIIA